MTDEEEKLEAEFLRGRGWQVDAMGCDDPHAPPGQGALNLHEALSTELARKPKLTTDEIAALAPSSHVVITDDNMTDERKKHHHPFTSPDRVSPGDVLWTLPPNSHGTDIVVVWARKQMAGLGKNKDGKYEGPISVVDGRLVLRDTKSGRRFTLVDGAQLPSGSPT